MPRNRKCRRVCAEPLVQGFWPEHRDKPPVILTVEELEALRLCDLEALEQNEAAARMAISRGTLQRILYAAHQKVAQALVAGRGIVIRGGQYVVRQEHCRCGRGCSRCAHAADTAAFPFPQSDVPPTTIQKEDDET